MFRVPSTRVNRGHIGMFYVGMYEAWKQGTLLNGFSPRSSVEGAVDSLATPHKDQTGFRADHVGISCKILRGWAYEA